MMPPEQLVKGQAPGKQGDEDQQEDAQSDPARVKADDTNEAQDALTVGFRIRTYPRRGVCFPTMNNRGRKRDRCEGEEQQSQDKVDLHEQGKDHNTDENEYQRVHARF
jgi:hypothetical protein